MPLKWMKGFTKQLPYRLRSFFGEHPEAAAAQLEQKTYLWALSYWLLTLYLPVFRVFQLALYCIWITDYNGHLLLRAPPNASLALVELLSGFTVVMLFLGGLIDVQSRRVDAEGPRSERYRW